MIQLPGLFKGYILVIFIIALQSKLVDLNIVKQNVNKNVGAVKSVAAAKSTDVPDKDYPMLFDVYMEIKTPAANVAVVVTTASTTAGAPSVTSNTPAPDIISTAASTTATSVASDASVSSSAPTASVTSNAPAASVASSASDSSVSSSVPTASVTSSASAVSVASSALDTSVSSSAPTASVTSSAPAVSVASSAPNETVPDKDYPMVLDVYFGGIVLTSSPAPATSASVSTVNVVPTSNTPTPSLVSSTGSSVTSSTVSSIASSAVMSVNSNMVSNLVQQPCSAQTSSLINTPSSIISSIVTNTPPSSIPAFPINTPSTIAPNFVINTPANSANNPGINDASNIIFDVEPNFGQNIAPVFPINTPSAVVTPGTNDGSNIIFDVEPTFESPISAYIPNNDIFFNIENDPVANFPNYLTTRTTNPAGQFNLVTPQTPFTTYVGSTTCICVPPGACVNPVPSDGAGIINVRSMSASKPRYEMPIPAGRNEISIQPFDFLNYQIEEPPANIQTCAFGLSRCCRRGSYQCGETYPSPPKSPKSDPGEAPYGAYPWMAALLLKPRDAFIGGGVLIDSRHIITAAHKVANVSVQYLKVRLGEWNAIRNNEPIPPIDLSVSKIVIHNGYTRSNLFNNIAVVRLTKPVALGVVPTIATACLTRDLHFGSNCYVAGWGKTKFSGAFSNVQKHVQVQIKKPSQCQQDLQKTILGPSFVFNSKSFICAGGESGRDACTGDGGSPLVCQINKRWAVVGLVAWGIGCGTNNVPGVYVNVPSYLNWVQDVVNAN